MLHFAGIPTHFQASVLPGDLLFASRSVSPIQQVEVSTGHNPNPSRNLHHFAFPWLWRHQDFTFSCHFSILLPGYISSSYNQSKLLVWTSLLHLLSSPHVPCSLPSKYVIWKNVHPHCLSASVVLADRHHPLCLLFPCFSKITRKGYCSEQNLALPLNSRQERCLNGAGS